jgi:diguanylate cyclase (GGDEF)-like protein/PAS domain S-box-containing protein
MFRAFSWLAAEHDWRLVCLAGTICFMASVAAVSLLQRARASRGRTRAAWLGLGAITTGSGIWATHFIALLAHDLGVPSGYDLGLTLLSLSSAIVVPGLGLAVALGGPGRLGGALGGAIIGFGIAAMHHTGMRALDIPGDMSFDPAKVALAIMAGAVLGAAALLSGLRRAGLPGLLGAALLLSFAVLSHHFTALGAVEVIQDPSRAVDALSLSPSTLALLIAGAVTTILGMSLVAALGDQRIQRKIREERAKLDSAMENMPLGVCMFDRDGTIVLFNERYADLMELEPAFLRGSSLLDVFRRRKTTGAFQGDPEEFFAHVRAEMNAGKQKTRVMETADGRSLRVVDQPIAGGGWIATFEDITEWRKAQNQITYLARHDPLTGLPNRMVFRDELEQGLRWLKPGEQLSVLCLDLDHFKDVNDTLGHPVGDELLKAVCGRLRDCAGELALVARLGGDEFAILHLDETADSAGSAHLASQLVDVIGAPYDLNGHQVVIGLSVGVAVAPDDAIDPDQLLKNADMALYRAKGDGRGTYRFFEPGMDARAQARRIMELELRTAIRSGEFDLYYQPIRDVRTDRITCFEALVRWNHPHRGIISPADFIPLAEETGLIVPIGEWVLQRACADAAQWPAPIDVAVNLSPVQFRTRTLIAVVQQALAASGLEPRRLELEITESVLLQDNEGTLEKLHVLRNFGVRISMDDFGTGYSSLSYLRSFPFDKIKIDRSFIHELPIREDSLAIIRAVTGLGKSLGIATTAEGVETEEQLRILRNEGCTEVQGYLFSPPRPLPEIEALLTRERQQPQAVG